MQNSVVPQLYPEKIVPPHVMNHAKSIDDIRDKTRFTLYSDGLNQKIILEYIDNDILVSLGFCRFVRSWSHITMKALYTSNLDGLDDDTKIKETIYTHTHILSSPIKYLGKEMFVKFLDICKDQWILSVKLTPYIQTNSVVFYQNIAKYFPDRIRQMVFGYEWEITYILK